MFFPESRLLVAGSFEISAWRGLACCDGPRDPWSFDVRWRFSCAEGRGEERSGSPLLDSALGVPFPTPSLLLLLLFVVVLICVVVFSVLGGRDENLSCLREVGGRVELGVPELRLASGNAVLWKT